MRTSVKVILAAAALTAIGSGPSLACGRGYNVDAYGRCFPAYLGTGVETGNRPYYAPRAYYAPRYVPQYYGGQPYYQERYYRRDYDPGAAIALGIAGAAAAAIASQQRHYRPKRYRHR